MIEKLKEEIKLLRDNGGLLNEKEDKIQFDTCQKILEFIKDIGLSTK